MKKCMKCGEPVSNPNHDYCYDCFSKIEEEDEDLTAEDHFENGLTENTVYTVYIMFYGDKNAKIGYTNDLNSRIIEIKRQYPKNKLVYFREFAKESEARRFEAWLKELSDRDINKFIATFQDKLRKVDNV